jgi:predicted dehydrogenase
MKIKLGIIGYGGMGKWHAQNAPRAGVEIAAVCDSENEKIQQGKDDGFVTYSSADELLKDENINTVILTVPNYLHKEMCLKAAKAGKHVVTEKPAALNATELDEMEAACKKAGVFFTSHQNRRWDKDVVTVKKILEDGSLGKVFSIESKLHTANGYMHEWHLYKKFGGGMLYDWGVHLIDQVLFIMPGTKVNTVYADIKNVLHDEVDDYFKLLLKMSNGVTAHIELSTYIMDNPPRWLVCGDKGTMVMNTFACDGQISRTNMKFDKLPARITETVAGPTRQFAPIPPGGIDEEPLPQVESDWAEFYRNVADTIDGKAESRIKIPEVRRVLALMEAAWKSSETGETVEFER